MVKITSLGAYSLLNMFWMAKEILVSRLNPCSYTWWQAFCWGKLKWKLWYLSIFPWEMNISRKCVLVYVAICLLQILSFQEGYIKLRSVTNLHTWYNECISPIWIIFLSGVRDISNQEKRLVYQLFGSTTFAKTGSDRCFSWHWFQAVSVVQSSDRSDNL